MTHFFLSRWKWCMCKQIHCNERNVSGDMTLFTMELRTFFLSTIKWEISELPKVCYRSPFLLCISESGRDKSIQSSINQFWRFINHKNTSKSKTTVFFFIHTDQEKKRKRPSVQYSPFVLNSFSAKLWLPLCWFCYGKTKYSNDENFDADLYYHYC